MRRYQTKRKVIEAVEWDGDYAIIKLLEESGCKVAGFKTNQVDGDEYATQLRIVSDGEDISVAHGDYIIKEQSGRWTARLPNLFSREFEPVPEVSP